jgi:PHP family Zn ribbon phosphoesterase
MGIFQVVLQIILPYRGPFYNNIINNAVPAGIMEEEYYTIRVCSECLNYYFVKHVRNKPKKPTACPNCGGEWIAKRG